MSKKTKNIIIFTSIAIIIILGILGFWYFKKAKTGQNFTDTFFDFKFPEFTDSPLNNKDGGADNPLSNQEKERQLFTQISNTQTAGAVFFNKTIGEDDEATTTPTIRFMERSTGYVYETNLSTLEQSRITNTTIPRIYEAIWGKDGENIILRYLDEDNETIMSFTSQIIEGIDGKEGALKGEFIQTNITDMIISPDKENIFYLREVDNDTIGTIADINGENKKNVFEFSFLEWLPQWSEAGIYLSTKPSYDTKGYSYKLNTRNGSLQKIIGGVNGLTVLASNSGEKVFYSESISDNINSYIYNIETQESAPIPLNTFADKCVWGASDIKIYCGAPVYFGKENYPDSWYQGKTSFDDLLWISYVDDNTIDIIGDPFEETGSDMDIINLFLSSDEQYLFFTNKKDMTLWMVDLSIYENLILEQENN